MDKVLSRAEIERIVKRAKKAIDYRPLTPERLDKLRKQIQRRMDHWPESRARAKAERRAALQLADNVLANIEAYHRASYNDLMSPTAREAMVRDVVRTLKLEDS